MLGAGIAREEQGLHVRVALERTKRRTIASGGRRSVGRITYAHRNQERSRTNGQATSPTEGRQQEAQSPPRSTQAVNLKNDW